MIEIADHPLLDAAVVSVDFPEPLGELTTPPAWASLLTATAEAPIASDDEVRKHVRDLLRHGGYKPTGRGKPASEYLLRAASQQKLGAINLAVDACNIVSLHSGLPISVVDLDRTNGALSIGIAPAGSRYIFNLSGQQIDLGGLLCLHDTEGPCANAVKDAQRTKTDATTRRALSVIWGTNALPGRTAAAFDWYAALLGECGLETSA